MKRTTCRRGFMLMLGLMVAMGMSLSVVEASAMAVGMAMSEKMPGMDGCNACKDGPDGTKMTCDASCIAPMNATMPLFDISLVEAPKDRPVPPPGTPCDWMAAPNPHPPKVIAPF